jgi:hypothetical protein
MRGQQYAIGGAVPIDNGLNATPAREAARCREEISCAEAIITEAVIDEAVTAETLVAEAVIAEAIPAEGVIAEAIKPIISQSFQLPPIHDAKDDSKRDRGNRST